MHAIDLDVEIEAGKRRKWPQIYPRSASWVLSKNSSAMFNRITDAVIHLTNFGLIRVNVKNYPDLFATQNVRKRCEEKFVTKIRVPEYNKSLGRVEDFTTMFLSLVVGTLVAAVVFVAEMFAKGEEGKEGKQNLKKEEYAELVMSLNEDDEVYKQVVEILNPYVKSRSVIKAW